IWVRGATVTRGYENDPDANRESFTGGWLKTGDCGYLDEEGYLFITGRLKEIINRGGEKISPREVDDVLMDHPAVAQAVTFPAPHPTLGEEVAAAVVLSNNGSVTERAIQEFAAARLADFKVPHKVLILDEIPKNDAGKVQRMGLAETLGVKFSAPESDIEAHYAPARTATEEKLAKIWSEVLGIDGVGIDDNFFALGGDSILASQIISRVNEVLHAELSFLDFFEAATIAAIAGRLENSGPISPAASSPPPKSQAKENLPLSYAQERLWFLEQLEPGSAAYNRPTFFRLTGRLDVPALERSLDEIAQRHEILRTALSSIEGQPYQNVSPCLSLNPAFVNLCSLSESARDAEAQRLAAEEAQKPFDLTRGPLLRAALLRLGDEEHVLLLTIHHIAFDGWSQGVLLRELVALYEAFSAGKPSPLPPLPIQYADFAVRQRHWLGSREAAIQIAYWKKQLKGAPPLLALPTDRARPAVQTFRGAREPLVLSPALSGSLKALSRQAEVSLFMTLLAAFQTLLSRATGQTDLSVGTFNANRASVDTEGMIGFFVNNLVLRGDLSGNPTFRELLGRARQVCLGAHAHRDLPFEKLLEELQPKRSLSYPPLFQVMLVLQNAPQPPLVLSSLKIQRYPTAERNRSNFDLTLELSEENEGLAGHLEYSTDLFDAATIRRMLQDFLTVLAAAVAGPDRRLLAEPPASSRQHAASAAALAERQARLSPDKQMILAQRLRGESADPAERIDVFSSETHSPGRRAAADRHSAPLSFAQQRLWFLDQLEPGSPLYNISHAARLNGSLNAGALRKALSAIVARHEALRTTFVSIHGDPIQRIAESRAVELPLVDLSGWPKAKREAEARRWLYVETSRPFNLSSDLMLRAALLRLDDEEHIFVLTMHHIASDAWSIGILMRELAALYADFCAGQPSRLPELPIQYADFAVWQRRWLQGEILERQLTYWKRQLAALPVTALPTDRPRPRFQSFRGAHRSVTLSESLSESLKNLSRREGVSLFMTLLAAFQTLLHRYTGQSDITVGSPIAGRNRQEIEGLIGFFVNTLVLRCDLSGDPTFPELLRRVRETALDAYVNQDLPFDRLVEELQPERDPSRHPLFQAMFALQNAATGDMKIAGLTASPVSIDRQTAKFDISLSMLDSDRGLTAFLAYNTDLFDAATMDRLLDHFQTLLQGVVADPARRLSDLPILTAAEKRQLLVDWNDTKKGYPNDGSIHELFEAQAERSSDAAAVVFETERLTYRELNRRANRLARYLMARGVAPGVPVAICMERSLDMVVGILGILKAGGAYVPLDPAYPKERLAYIIRDARAAALLTQRRLAEELMEGLDPRISVIPLDTEWETISHESAANPGSAAAADDPAYIIYTSGSTGQPKGVEVTHRALANFVAAAREMFALEPGDRVLQFASLAFDASAEEIFPCLAGGATLILRTDWMVESASLFLQKCRDWGVTVLDLPTVYWHELTENLASEQLTLPADVRLVIIGGERAAPERLAIWQRRVGSRVRLLNTYGPTEGTVVSTAWESTGYVAESAPIRQVPIGRPIANVQTYVLDRNLNPVPIGVSGELHIAGAGLARAYFDCPDLTAEKFIPNPFSSEPGSRLYKTGDLGRYLADGNIEFLQRIDTQVKIRGFRIELGEIEAALNQHPAVREAVVVARADTREEPHVVENPKSKIQNPKSDNRLVAYIVSIQDRIDAGKLRAFLQAKLPDYMLPSVFVFLDSLPLTPSGKIDRKALPAPD
ncbi:MAG: amino acid adenylation domain-containing protein, partial [Candidatus Binatia bacterium]